MSDSREKLQTLVEKWRGEAVNNHRLTAARAAFSICARELSEALLAAQGGQHVETIIGISDPYERVFGIKAAAPPVQGAGTPWNMESVDEMLVKCLGARFHQSKRQAVADYLNAAHQSPVEALREALEKIKAIYYGEIPCGSETAAVSAMGAIADDALAAQEKPPAQERNEVEHDLMLVMQLFDSHADNIGEWLEGEDLTLYEDIRARAKLRRIGK